MGPWCHDEAMTPGRRGPHVELGCGSTPPIARSASVTIGVDVDADALGDMRRASPRSVVVCADATSLPFRGDSIESVSLRAVLHHLVPLDAAIDEIARVLSHGSLVSVVDGVALDRDEVESLEAELGSAGRAGEPTYGFDLDELTVRLHESGLVVEQVELDGTATFATPPIVSRAYSSDRFRLTARKARSDRVGRRTRSPSRHELRHR